MAYTIKTEAGLTVARELLILYLNTGTSSAPVWSPIGRRVESADMEKNYDANTIRDILGDVYSSLKKPIISQSFDPWPLDSGDAAASKVWSLDTLEQNVQALANQDVLVAHLYTTDGETTAKSFGERYPNSMIEPTRMGGDGGGDLTQGCNVTFGGTRAVGAVTVGTGGTVSFAPAA